MALEVWSKIQFCNDIFFSEDGTNIILNNTAGTFITGQLNPQALKIGGEIISGSLSLGRNTSIAKLAISMKANSYLDTLNLHREYQSNEYDSYLKLGTHGEMLIENNSGLHIFSGTEYFIPDTDKEKTKAQYCFQQDTSNGALTLRPAWNIDPYVVLYQLKGDLIGNHIVRSAFDRLESNTFQLKTYKEGKSEVGKALTDFEARLDAQGFNSAPFGARTSNNFLFTTNSNGIDGGIDKLVGSIHQSGAITEVIIDKDKTDFTDLAPSDGSESNNYYIRTTQLSNWNGEKFNINLPTAHRDDNEGQPWIESYDIIGKISKKSGTTILVLRVIIRVSIHYTNITNSPGYITFRIVDTAIEPDINQSFNNTAFCWRTIY